MTRHLLNAIVLLSCAACTGGHTITVRNSSDIDRKAEIVEVDTAALKGLTPGSFIILDAEGSELPYQLTHEGKIIFPATVKAGAESRYTLKEGTPAPVDTLVCGRLVPERLDDMAWENDLGAYRAYGPALQRTGERAFGYDVWTKSVSQPVVNKRYYDHINRGISFHEDHGEGMDVYAVGPTLGAGTAALLDSASNIVYPYCFADYEILDNGPLRFCVRLTYAPLTVDTDTVVVETRVISLDKGDFLNRTTVSYSGLSGARTIMPGIVVHESNPEAYVLNPEAGTMAYADLTQNPGGDNGIIFTGLVSPASDTLLYLPFAEAVADACGHIAAPANYEPGDAFTYWWGASWSKGFVPDMEAWQAALADFAARRSQPLTITVD